MEYETLYVKKGKDAIDPEADLEGAMGHGGRGQASYHHMQHYQQMQQNAMQHASLPDEMSMAMGGHMAMQHKKNLSVEIPGGGMDPQQILMGQLGELHTPNSMALFNQLGNSLLPVSEAQPSLPPSLRWASRSFHLIPALSLFAAKQSAITRGYLAGLPRLWRSR